MTRRARSRARDIYFMQLQDCGPRLPAAVRNRRDFAAADARNFRQPVYQRMTLARDPEKAGPVSIQGAGSSAKIARPSYSAVALSSMKSGCCRRVNSMAKPSSI